MSSELRRVEPELFPFSDYPVSAQEGLHIATLEERNKMPGNRYRPHRHDFYQIFWLTQGERSFTIDFNNFPVRGPPSYSCHRERCTRLERLSRQAVTCFRSSRTFWKRKGIP